MKLFRHGKPGAERPGVMDNSGVHKDVSAFGKDFTPEFFEGNGTKDLQQWMKSNEEKCPVLEKIDRYGPPLVGVSKIVCIGLNFSDHAAESNMPVPSEPVIFFKATSAICGPNDDVVIPRNSSKTDWEVELAVVIGKKASYVEEKDALQHVAGYMLHNDYSERAFQLERNGQWVKGKSCDTFAPIGPYIVTPDEIKDVNNLSMWLDVNGGRMQNGNSKNLIYKIPFLISYVSQFMSLLPGDIISTGTPAGVGMGQKPLPVYLKNGDEVRLGIDGLGESRQKLVSFSKK